MYRGRGISMPNISNDNNNSGGRGGDSSVTHDHSYVHVWNRYYYYDENFILIESIVDIAIILLGIAVFIITYKTTFKDPIASIKRNFINAQLMSLLILSILVIIASFLSKSKKTVIKNLIIISILSIIISLVFISIKSNLDKVYTEEKFLEFYETSEYKKSEKNISGINISFGVDGLKVGEAKDKYVYESITAYKFFTYKFMGIISLNFAIVVFNIFMIIRLLKKQELKEKLDKNDAIVFDEEINVRY